MNSLFKAAVICLGTLATVSAAEAMPALSPLPAAPEGVTVGGAQLDKVVVVITRRVRRPAIVVRRRPAVVRRTVIRRF